MSSRARRTSSGLLSQWYLGSDHLEAPVPVTAHRGKAYCSPSLISRDSSPTLTSMVRPRPSVCTATIRLSSLSAISSCVLRNRRGNETSFSLSFGFGLKQSTPSWISPPCSPVGSGPTHRPSPPCGCLLLWCRPEYR